MACVPTDSCRGRGESQLLAGSRNTLMGSPCEGFCFLGLTFVCGWFLIFLLVFDIVYVWEREI